MTLSTGKRSYRACDRCRSRKIRCDFTSVGEKGKPPCLECHRSGHDCTWPPSGRGGDHSKHRRKHPRVSTRSGSILTGLPQHNGPRVTGEIQAVLRDHDEQDVSPDLKNYGNPSMDMDELRNPSDALQILARSASRRGEGTHTHGAQPIDPAIENDVQEDHAAHDPRQSHPLAAGRSPAARCNHGIENYKLVAQGLLDIAVVQRLIFLYLQNYHHFVPIVSKHILEPTNINDAAKDEPFLLTVILTIASKDEPAWESVHRQCWGYMQELLLDVLLARPHTHHIGLVEGLLLLSDWLPAAGSDTSSASKSLSAEDATAWSLIGQAVRHGYLLRLDRASFRQDICSKSKEETDRMRLVWTFVYLADRQISVRLGQAFWSRGPSLSSRFTAKDFPTLQASSTGDDDHASVLQAMMELTQLLHNAHDILYSSRIRTEELILAGDYNRYLDDLQRALSVWDESWRTLAVSPTMKCALTLMYEYLCLYVNAFAFQARAILLANEALSQVNNVQSTLSQRRSLFPRGIIATPEGRYIFEALRAAKSVLHVMGQADPVSCLRYMPTRYYLYSVYSAVFLYKANSFGAFPSHDEQDEVANLVGDFIFNLQKAATAQQHVAWRYSKMLKALSFRSNNPDALPRSFRNTARPHQRSVLFDARDSSRTGFSHGATAIQTGNLHHESASTTEEVLNTSNHTALNEPEPDTVTYSSDLDPFGLASTPQTNALFEALFGSDNSNFVPPFSDDGLF